MLAIMSNLANQTRSIQPIVAAAGEMPSPLRSSFAEAATGDPQPSIAESEQHFVGEALRILAQMPTYPREKWLYLQRHIPNKDLSPLGSS